MVARRVARRKATGTSVPPARAYSSPALKRPPPPWCRLPARGSGDYVLLSGSDGHATLLPSLTMTRPPEIRSSTRAAAIGSFIPVRHPGLDLVGQEAVHERQKLDYLAPGLLRRPAGSQPQSKRVQPPAARTFSSSLSVSRPRNEGRQKYPHRST